MKAVSVAVTKFSLVWMVHGMDGLRRLRSDNIGTESAGLDVTPTNAQHDALRAMGVTARMPTRTARILMENTYGRSLGRALLGIALFAACGGSPLGALSPAAMPSALGGPCADNSGCQPDLYCETGDPEGRCLKECASSTDCSAGAICVDGKRCMQACKTTAECGRPSYVCWGAAPTMFCDVSREIRNQRAIRKAVDEAEMYGL
jgi:hypothetical protein